MSEPALTLEDRYARESGRVLLSGTQALVRLLLMQRRRDAQAGIETAGFVSGYRGSPLGALDRELWRAREQLDRHHIRFVPGVNEDLAATAVWGSQQTGLFPGARYDGVFGMWYGKGPGTDRSGDAFKHANNAGTAALGGVLAVAGDDHICRSSTLPHQSEFAFVDAMIPVLNPAGVQEIIDLGLAGWALSRFSGLWVGLIAVAETVEQTACVDVDPGRVVLAPPEDYALPPGGLNIRWPDAPLDQEARLHRYKLDAARAFVRANRLDRIVADGPNARLGVVAAGKSHLDVLQALEMLGLDLARAGAAGLRLYKPAMTWPLEPEGLAAFAAGLEEIVVVEEKRALIEPQIKDVLYALPDGTRPRVIGKRDETGAPLFPSEGELAPALIARALGPRLARIAEAAGDAGLAARIEERLAELARIERARAAVAAPIERKPYFCSGCPHNSSTKVPEGSLALAGIGCHYMALWMDRNTRTFTQMGGEGANWIGLSPFTETPHVFQNIGDGTYFHSGLLAIRAAIGAKANMTYKILYNDAVAMTGGQPVDGPLSVARITHELYGEGVARIAIVTDDPGKYRSGAALAPGVRVYERAALDRVQREMRAVPGVTVIIYDRACATETRRKRKRGQAPDPPRRVFINADVCEGCGDCGLVSNCLSLLPVETPFGRKRAIDQSACNKDFTCLDGLCPSFVTVEGGRLRKPRAAAEAASMPPEPPEPALPALDAPYGVVATGVGGTGVVTLGALLGLAAHIEGKGVTVFDMTGLAQKYGAVTSHLRIARAAEDIHAARIAEGGARLVLGCDLVVAGSAATLAVCDPEATVAVVNDRETPTGDFARDPDFAVPGAALRETIARATREAAFVDATGLATRLLGDAIAANMLLLGHAWQQGLIPVGRAAILRAIEANGVAVELNKRAFAWGRIAAHDPAAVAPPADDGDGAPPPPRDLDGLLARLGEELAASRNADLARRYADLVARVRAVEAARAPGRDDLARAVARSYFKLLAYKDEYEVARLFADGRFLRAIEAQFEGDYRLRFHLAPPLFARTDPATGRPVKKSYGPWMMGVFRLLARLKGLRGTALDPFARTAERRAERRLIAEYEATIEEILAALDESNHALAVEIAALPESIRGFGPVKAKAIEAAKAREAALLAAFRDSRRDRSAAE